MDWMSQKIRLELDARDERHAMAFKSQNTASKFQNDSGSTKGKGKVKSSDKVQDQSKQSIDLLSEKEYVEKCQFDFGAFRNALEQHPDDRFAKVFFDKYCEKVTLPSKDVVVVLKSVDGKLVPIEPSLFESVMSLLSKKDGGRRLLWKLFDNSKMVSQYSQASRPSQSEARGRGSFFPSAPSNQSKDSNRFAAFSTLNVRFTGKGSGKGEFNRSKSGRSKSVEPARSPRSKSQIPDRSARANRVSAEYPDDEVDVEDQFQEFVRQAKVQVERDMREEADRLSHKDDDDDKDDSGSDDRQDLDDTQEDRWGRAFSGKSVKDLAVGDWGGSSNASDSVGDAKEARRQDRQYRRKFAESRHPGYAKEAAAAEESREKTAAAESWSSAKTTRPAKDWVSADWR